MSQAIEALPTLFKLSSDNSVPDDTFSINLQAESFNSLVSSKFNEISETNLEFKNVINTLSQSPEFTSDPHKLLMLQNYIGEYTNHVSLVSTLARKGVSTIETLVKSQ